jgi:hypothetical protein
MLETNVLREQWQRHYNRVRFTTRRVADHRPEGHPAAPFQRVA